MKITRTRKKLKQNNGETLLSVQLKDAGKLFSFEPCSFTYSVPTKYTPDFVYESSKGPVYVESKGYHAGMGVWLNKITHFWEQHPNIDFRIVFQDATKKVNKNYKSNLGDWATKKGIKWADNGKIPKEWLDE
jgi:hypothetical protein